MMKQVSNMEEFVKVGNLTDLEKIVNSKFKNILPYATIEEVVNSFVVKCLENKIIERYDPDKNVLFSTYMYRCFFNFVLAYYCKPGAMTKAFREATSLDFEFGDNNTSMHNVIFEDDGEGLKLSAEKKLVYRYLKEKDRKLGKATIPLHKLYSYIINGYTDKDIADMSGLTVAGVGARKKKLVRKLKVFYKV